MTMRISKLSYEIEDVKIIDEEDDNHTERYTAFFYTINGERIPWPKDDYIPVNAYDVVDEEAAERNLVVLFRCLCGSWGCSATLAHVHELHDNIIEWTVYDSIGAYMGPESYYFRKDEYEATMKEIREKADQIIRNMPKFS